MNKMDLFKAIGIVDEDILERSEKNSQKTNRKTPQKALSLIAAIMSLIVITVSAYASSKYDLGFHLSTRFGGTVDMLDSITAVPANVDYQSTNKSIEFSVVGITGDRNNMYVWLTLTLPESVYEQYGNDFIIGFDGLSIQGIEDSHTRPHVFITGESIDNRYAFGVLISQSDGATLIGRKIKLQFENLNIMLPRSSESIKIADGKWSSSLSLNVPDLMKTYTPDIAGAVLKTPEDPNEAEHGHNPMSDFPRINEIVVDSCSVNLSPMSVTVRFDYYEEFSHYFEGPINISVVLEDGTEHKVGILSSYREFRKNEGCIKEINAVFDEPIVTSDAAYIKYGETIIPLN